MIGLDGAIDIEDRRCWWNVRILGESGACRVTLIRSEAYLAACGRGSLSDGNGHNTQTDDMALLVFLGSFKSVSGC